MDTDKNSEELEPSNQYDAATLEMLYQRRESHLNGQSISYSAQEAIESVKRQGKIS